MSGRRKRSSAGKLIAIVILLLIILLVLIAYLILTGRGDSNPATSGIQHEITRQVTKKAVDKVISEESGGEVSLDDIESQMTEEDSEQLNDIVDKYTDSGLVSEAISIYTSNGGDLGATADELKDKVSPEDIAALEELYSKYAK